MYVSAVGKRTPTKQERHADIPIVDNKNLREELIHRIEAVTLMIIEQINSGRSPIVSYHTASNDDWFESRENEENSFPSLICLDGQGTTMNVHANMIVNHGNQKARFHRREIAKTLDFAHKRNKNKFALMIKVIAVAHRLLITNSTITKRSFYYDLKNDITMNLAPEQKYVDDSVNEVACLLDCSPWDLRLIATAKGLIMGDLTLHLTDDRIIDCGVPGGTLIPQIISNVIALRSGADFVLIVEKDAVFQKLLEERCSQSLNCILVTGKGYPDVATRMFVKLLSTKLDLPVYVIVDADPFGFDIMCVYRFGSMTLLREKDSLACIELRWLGVHPSELAVMGVKTTPLADTDLRRLASIESRPYMTGALLNQAGTMRKGKAEIEAISCLCQNFLTATYLPWKIRGKDYI